MGAVEDAVDAAADFIGPFVDKSRKQDVTRGADWEPSEFVHQAISHLRAINAADVVAEPDAPYDASLAGVVYGLLDMIISLGVLPHLSPGVAFSQRPRSVLTAILPVPLDRNMEQLSNIIGNMVPILEQMDSGVRPLLSQRILPDIISALAELSYSPQSLTTRREFMSMYENIIKETPTSRLLPIFATFLQQPLPIWLKPHMSKELAMLPRRQHGIRHMIEFLALSFLSKSSHIPQDATSRQSQIPIPIEAITQASRLLVLPPQGVDQDEWLRQLAPQLMALLDGSEGLELSRAAGQIIAGGILSKRATGAPDTVGWSLFAEPLLRNLQPEGVGNYATQSNSQGQVLVPEEDLKRTLVRLSAIVLSYSHAGLLKRLIGPVLLPIWALLNYAHAMSALDRNWATLSESILLRYTAVACDPKQINNIAKNIFWDGDTTWTFGPGSQGGVEIRRRSVDDGRLADMDNVLTRIGSLDSKIRLLVSLLADAKIPDEVTGPIFLQVTKRWLSPAQDPQRSLLYEADTDPLAALTDAKLCEAMVARFKDQFARSPQHIIELMRQLISNFVSDHQARVQSLARNATPSRAGLGHISRIDRHGDLIEYTQDDTADEDLVSFAVSILSTLVTSANFKQTPETRKTLASIITPLVYLSQAERHPPISPLITNSANLLLQLLQPTAVTTQTRANDPLAEHRATLKAVLADLTSPEPPNRTWALGALHKIIRNAIAFPVIDIPSMVHLLLSASLADPESYVYTAAVPVLVDLATRAPNPTLTILVDAFVDADERSLRLGQGKQTEDKDRELQQALEFRLRVGEVLNSYVLDRECWHSWKDLKTPYRCMKQITEACLSLASRRGKRTQTLSTRTQLAQAERVLQEEGEKEWSGPIPNLLDPDSEDLQDQADRDALLKIVRGWEDTGIEEDVRVRASALSVLSTTLEHRLGFARQVTIDAALQMVLLIVTIEISEAKSILRRAAVLVIMGLLRGVDGALGMREEMVAGLGITQQAEIERVVKWVGDEDVDALVRDHATNVLESLETLRMKKLYRLGDDGLRLGVDMGLEGALRGLDVQPGLSKKLVVEEVVD